MRTGDAAARRNETMHAPPLAEHRLLGADGMAALVGRDATIDWWCQPRLDDDPVLWRLLDAEGAVARWRGATEVRSPDRTVGPSLRTEVDLGGELVTCWDAVLRVEGAPLLARLARSSTRDLQVVHELHAVPFRAQAPDIAVRPLSGTTKVVGQMTTTMLDLEARAWNGLVLGDPRVVTRPFDVTDIVAAIDEAEARHGHRTASARVITSHRERVAVALGVLDACTADGTGAVVASPTTSLPEARGGDRQFDYRYAWLRDASLAASVAALVGDTGVAERHVRWLVERCVACEGVPTPVTAVDGSPVPEEREVSHVDGWAGSRPVRVGNAAKDQLQLDGPGMVAEAVWILFATSGRRRRDAFDVVADLADACLDCRDDPSSGIWELRQPAPVSSADAGLWLLFDRSVRLSWVHEPWAWRRRRRWRSARRRAMHRFLDGRLPSGAAPVVYGCPEADGAGLLPVVLGLLPRSAAEANAVVDGTIAELGVGAPLHGVRRYPAELDDGFVGDEGAFVPVSWWAVSALAQLGRCREAHDLADRLCRSLPGLQGEVIAPDGEMLGNTPLVWSHAEAARALYLLRVADVRARFGRPGLAFWRAQRVVPAWLHGRAGARARDTAARTAPRTTRTPPGQAPPGGRTPS